MLSVCCINFSNVASEAGGTEEGPTAELASDAVHEAAAQSVRAAVAVYPHAHSKISSSP